MTFHLGPALLFCPANRPDRYQKALERADAVIIDLEDAVAPDDREDAREALVQTPLDPERVVVRINPVGSHDFSADLSALEATAYRYVMLPKAEHPDAAAAVAGYRVVALCETAAGVLAAPDIALQPNVVALMWGAEDLVASLGGTSSRFADGRYRAVADHARSQVLLAAGAAGIAAIDTVHLDIADLARSLGRGDGCRSQRLRRDSVHPSRPGRDHPRGLHSERRGDRRGARRDRRRSSRTRGVPARRSHGRRARPQARRGGTPTRRARLIHPGRRSPVESSESPGSTGPTARSGNADGSNEFTSRSLANISITVAEYRAIRRNHVGGLPYCQKP